MLFSSRPEPAANVAKPGDRTEHCRTNPDRDTRQYLPPARRFLTRDRVGYWDRGRTLRLRTISSSARISFLAMFSFPPAFIFAIFVRHGFHLPSWVVQSVWSAFY